ncbi:MAG: glycosyltransferase family 9 protein [Ignavibacteria bacterium]|nr:glycosyltransferase family 9 protein [Ignavibacteria bacterium]
MTEILIIRPQSIQLGDTICSLPMFKALKKKYPESFITFVGCPTNYDVKLKKLNPYLDEVMIFRKDKLKTLLDFIKNLRKKKYDIVVVPSTIRISWTSYMIAFLAKGKLKIGFKRIDEEKNKLSFVLDVKEEAVWKKDKTHQVYRFLDSVKSIGCSMALDEIKNMRIGLTEEEKQFGLKYISENFPDAGKPIFGFHPGAGEKENIWNVINYFELIKRICEKYNSYILITSGYVDGEITAALESRLKEAGIKYTCISNMDTYNLASVLSRLKLYVSADTGVMHLAAYSGADTLTVFRSGKPSEWLPLFNNAKYIESKTGNINDITVEEVFEKIKEF